MRSPSAATFDKAVLKLAAIYTAVLALVVLMFSLAFYFSVDAQFNRPWQTHIEGVRERLPDGNAESFRIFIAERDNEMRANLILQLVFTGVAITALGALISYFVARLTLQPIADNIERQAQFISDASHELRTPLAAIIMENEVLLRDKTTTKELHDQVTSNLEEAQKLQRLVTYLLELNHDEAVTEPADREVVIERIISILRENAIKYDPEHREPQITRNQHEIKVIDRGVGIADQDLQHIFDRFYRADSAHSTDGYGLGLPLAQKLAAQIGAKVSAANNPDGGATFTVTFSHSSA
jgi:signal transduction histidine kinase